MSASDAPDAVSTPTPGACIPAGSACSHRPSVTCRQYARKLRKTCASIRLGIDLNLHQSPGDGRLPAGRPPSFIPCNCFRRFQSRFNCFCRIARSLATRSALRASTYSSPPCGRSLTSTPARACCQGLSSRSFSSLFSRPLGVATSYCTGGSAAHISASIVADQVQFNHGLGRLCADDAVIPRSWRRLQLLYRDLPKGHT